MVKNIFIQLKCPWQVGLFTQAEELCFYINRQSKKAKSLLFQMLLYSSETL